MSTEKLYIVSDIAMANGKSRSCMLNLIRLRDGLKFAKNVKVMGTYRAQNAYAFPESMLVNMGFAIPEKAYQPPVLEEKLTLEEMKARHPLVKDERFFKLSYFPEIRLESEINATKEKDK